MEHSYWSMSWGLLLWVGIWFLMISSFGNWGYTYKVHRRFIDIPQKTALNILNERYARGDITQEEFHRMKNEIKSNNRDLESTTGTT